MNRRELLEQAAGPLNDERKAAYGDFHDCMEMFGRKIRKMFTEFKMHEKYGDAHNGAFALAQLKSVRILLGRYHEDNYLDFVNYGAQANDSHQRSQTVAAGRPIGNLEFPETAIGTLDAYCQEQNEKQSQKHFPQTEILHPDHLHPYSTKQEWMEWGVDRFWMWENSVQFPFDSENMAFKGTKEHMRWLQFGLQNGWIAIA